MDPFSCDECRAIHRELRDAYLAATGSVVDRTSVPQQIADWVQQLNEEDCARMRETSSLWAAWRRLQEHRTLTGHYLSRLPVAPDAISNPN
jgi:hypothetical protein